jgi:hypothetical protein
VVALLALVVAAGCSSTGPKNVDRFLGTWRFDTGMAGGTCLGMPISNDVTGQSFTLAQGTSSDILSTFGTCMVTLSVDGTRASASPDGQMCMFTLPVAGQNVTANIVIMTWTNDTTDGMHLTVSAMGTGKGGLADGCPVTLTGAATKTSGADAASGG